MRLTLLLSALCLVGCVGDGGPPGAGSTGALVGFDTYLAADTPVALFNGSGQYCRRGAIGPAPSGPVIERERETLTEALLWFSRALSIGFGGGEASATALGDRMAALARANAFVRLDWSGSGSSPAHWQANLLKNIAMGVNIVDTRGRWAAEDRDAVMAWGDRVARSIRDSRTAGRHADWPDTNIATGTAYLMWGIASGNRRSFRDGLRLYDRVAGLIGPDGSTAFFLGNPGRFASSVGQEWLMALDDKTIGDLVLAAHAADAIGVNLFERRVSDASLYDAVLWWQGVLFEDTHPDLSEGQRRRFLSLTGGERSWAWTEYFIAAYPDDPQTARLRAENRAIAGGRAYAAQAQGPSSCLVR